MSDELKKLATAAIEARAQTADCLAVEYADLQSKHIKAHADFVNHVQPDDIVALTARVAELEGAREAQVSVREMKTSAGSEWWVVVQCGGRELTPYMSKIKGRAEYSAAEWRWLFNGGEKPSLVDWLDRTGDRRAAAMEGS